MDQHELLTKLAQIEEQAKYTLAEFPKTLTKERLRMIVALARYLRTEVSNAPPVGAIGLDEETLPAFGADEAQPGRGHA